MHYRIGALLVGLLFALCGSAKAQDTGPYIQVSPTPSKLSVGGPGFVQIDENGIASIAAAAPGSGNVTAGSALLLNHMVVGNGGSDIKTLGGTIGGAFTTAGAFTTTGAVSGVTLAFPSGGPFTYTFPLATATLASLAGSETFTNKIYSGGQLSGSFSGNPTFLGVPLFTNLSSGTQTVCLGLDSTFHLVTSVGACSSGGSGITQLTGDITAGPGSGSQAATLANTSVTPNSYTNTNLTVDSKGRITAASNGSASSATGVGVQTGQSPINIGDNATALPSGHYYYATNVAMTAQRTHALPDSATQGVGDIEVFDPIQTITATNQLCVQAAGTDKLNNVTNGTACITTAGGSLYLHNDGAGVYTTGAAASIPPIGNGQIIVGKTGSPSNTVAAVTPSQDCTVSNTGVFTCTKTSNVAFGTLATATPGTGVTTAVAANLSAAGGLTTTIASGTSSLGTSAIASAACASAVTTAATNTATTDVVTASFNGDPTAVTGYVPLTTGMLTIIAYPTTNNVNFKVCNNTSASITPGAITLNWRVVR